MKQKGYEKKKFKHRANATSSRSEIVDSAFAFSFRKAKTNKWADDKISSLRVIALQNFFCNKFKNLFKRRKLSKKMRNLILVESIMMTVIFGFVMYCQFFVAMNTFFDSLKVACTFIIPLIIYAVPTGISYMIRGQIFMGEYEESLDEGQPKNLTLSGERLAFGH